LLRLEKTDRLRWNRLVFCLISIALLVGCESEPVGPGQDLEGPAIKTDQLSYVAVPLEGEGDYRRYGFTVVAEFTNLTDRNVFLGRCYPDSPTPMFSVYGDGFGSAYSGVWACVGHKNQFRVKPGQSRVDTLHLRGPSRWSAGEPQGELEGRVRLRYFVGYCTDDCPDEAPDSLSSSDFFEVTLGS